MHVGAVKGCNEELEAEFEQVRRKALVYREGEREQPRLRFNLQPRVARMQNGVGDTSVLMGSAGTVKKENDLGRTASSHWNEVI